ncbi:serine hydrolase domain-containing protein [Phytoactinopolyspora mesophila]|uniref:Serine hydrolase n=1 Tax=Phytoactinopolyspora mesophila TaxID=2650750 RepID=A0A7K3MCQ4_9ACTN|nr:serine hydrolase domain-containing protein [Phytoactinopolyspora mesophila]NDL60827.1 serine hydrolase [Phytoactinopolyspora mesophila]
MFVERGIQPSIIATHHLSEDKTAGELTGQLAPDTRFPIGSVAKTLAALLAARLHVDDVVDCDEPFAADNDGHRTTLRGLLSHTAQLPFELHPDHWGPKSLNRSDVEAALLDPPGLRLPPGTWHYSNLGYALMARRLEQITGQDYIALLSDHLLEPLDMGKTSFPDQQTEGPCILGAAAPSGDLWSTLHDLMVLAQAIGGHRPDVVNWRMLSLLLTPATPGTEGAGLGSGIRTERVGHHRVLVSTGTISDRTTCVVVWPRRGFSVLVAERGYSHASLWQTAAQRWRHLDVRVRTWWWDGQEVIELRQGDAVELVVMETTWPFPVFAGHAHGRTLIGVDWSGDHLELLEWENALVGPQMRLTSDVADSAHPG